MKTVLTIAGSDCSGGAGIQADIKTITAHKMYAMSAITAVTAQNTTGVYDITELSADMLEAQLKSVFNDIFPDSVKIGMVKSSEHIEVIAKNLEDYKAGNVVFDPVMISSSGKRLMEESAIDAAKRNLLPKVTLVTPNIPEAQVLSGITITDDASRERAGKRISNENNNIAVLIKGGHAVNNSDDMLYHDGRVVWFKQEKIENENNHGTGCTLSSAIACNMARGCTLEESIRRAKAYLTGALKDGLNLGKGNGPLNHTYWLSVNDVNQ